MSLWEVCHFAIGKEVEEESVESLRNGEYTVYSVILKKAETETTIRTYFQTNTLPLPAHTTIESFWSLIVHDSVLVTVHKNKDMVEGEKAISSYCW